MGIKHAAIKTPESVGLSSEWNANHVIDDDVNFNQYEAQELVIENLAAAPVAPVDGQIYYDTTLNEVRYWNGSAWTGGVAIYLRADGSIPLTANWDIGGFKLTNVLDPTAAQDAATKNYVDTRTITYQYVEGTTDISTSSASYVDMTTMTLTTSVTGTYLILASAGIQTSSGSGTEVQSQMRVLVNASEIGANRSDVYNNHAAAAISDESVLCVQAIKALSAGDVVKMQWRLQAGGLMRNEPASHNHTRTLAIIKLA
jgi:hypothetical protein